MKVHFEEKKRVAFYGSKQTKNPPFCGVSHLRIGMAAETLSSVARSMAMKDASSDATTC